MTASPVIRVIRPGDTSKLNPYTVAIVANPALEVPWQSGAFSPDPIMLDHLAFEESVNYIEQALFGSLPGQREQFINDPTIGPHIRVVSVFDVGLTATYQNSLVAQDGASNQLIARRSVFVPFLSTYNLDADVIYAVSKSATHTRATSWFTSDDDARPGIPFAMDGRPLVHRFYNLIPGTVAIHTTNRSLIALHEFGHAASSYTNGAVFDLYIDLGPSINKKLNRPIPVVYGNYNSAVMSSDRTRGGIGYPPTWMTYHCELLDAAFPGVMDDYLRAASHVPEDCQHDRITRQFLIDRLRAKISRP